MRRRLLIALLLFPLAAEAGSSVRYALVIGNNRGVSPDPSLELEPLLHAERDAAALARRLVQLGNFQADHVELVVGGGKQAILAAAERLALRRKHDLAELGPHNTLFALFFTGHGLSGRLLTTDAPLEGADLSAIVSAMDARLSVAFVDACYSGSFDWEALKAKGARPTPGFNPITELPKEVLESEGAMWFVSSQSGELSYEDKHLGGLFTHFLLEGFTEAPQDGVGVSLENLWEYARQRTSTFAAARGRSQNPERIVQRLKSRSPIYVSFPKRRTAALQFDAALEGTFLLQYEQAALVENIVKRAGHPLEVATYDGDVVLSRVSRAKVAASQRLTLSPGATVMVRSEGAVGGAVAPGFTEVPIRAKGAPVGLSFTERAGQPVLGIGAAYRPSLPAAGLLGVLHAAGGTLGVMWGRLGLNLSVGAGQGGERFAEWSYRLGLVYADLFAACGFDLWGLRLALEAGGGPRFFQVRYDDGAGKQPVGAWVGGAARLELGLPFKRPWVLLQARAGLGAGFTPSVAAGDGRLYPTASPLFEAGLAFPLFL